MKVFIDTSAFLAVLNADDRFHERAGAAWRRELAADTRLVTTNYVVLETAAILQHRLGLRALRVFVADVVPALEVRWVDESLHAAAVSAVLAAGRRKLSLVDCTSFEVARACGADACFAFDEHFPEQGFAILE